jgi:hypothetical protein
MVTSVMYGFWFEFNEKSFSHHVCVLLIFCLCLDRIWSGSLCGASLFLIGNLIFLAGSLAASRHLAFNLRELHVRSFG